MTFVKCCLIYEEVSNWIPVKLINLLQIFSPSETIENISDEYWNLRAEEVKICYLCYIYFYN